MSSTRIKLYLLLLILFVPALTVSAKHPRHRKQRGQENIIINDPETIADTIYHNGTIITVNDAQPFATAVAVKDYLILAVGSWESVNRYNGPETKVFDLMGRTMMPGFYDSHSHFMLNTIQLSQGFDIASPPIGKVTKIQDIIDNVKQFMEKNNSPDDSIVFGCGYSDIDLAEKRHPNKFDLDQISNTTAIILVHSSMHIAAVNSYALKKSNLLTIEDIPEDQLEMFQMQNGEFTGVIKQLGLMKVAPLIEPILTDPQILNKGFYNYLSMGFTAAQDILNHFNMGYLYSNNSNGNYTNVTRYHFPINIDAYLMVTSINDAPNWEKVLETQKDNFKVKGIKFMMDGSIQGYTAFMNQPYYVPPIASSETQYGSYNYAIDRNQSCEPPYCGIQTHTNLTAVNQIIAVAYGAEIDILTHCNGDAATDQLIVAVREAKKRYPNIARKPRLVVIHAQTLTEEQLDQMVKLEMTPSFFPSHTFYWGDSHNDTFLGPEKAKRISPSRSAISRNMKFTLHNDACVTPLIPNGAFQIIWSAVNRRTSQKNLTLGQQQKITPLEALKGVTINAAWQAREDEHKGSIAPGKDADLIIVSDNLLRVPEFQIRNITVLYTIKDGAVLYIHQNITNFFPPQSAPKEELRLRRM